MKRNHAIEQGVGLIDLVIAIVLIAIASTAILPVTATLHRRSADPMIQAQAVAIGQAYLEEMSSRAFCDPDWDPDANPATPTSCPASCTQAVCAGCRGNGASTEASRADFDDICDYDAMTDTGARDQTAGALSALSAYTVTTSVQASDVVLYDLSGNSGQVAMLQVRIVHPAIDPIVLSTYRTNTP